MRAGRAAFLPAAIVLAAAGCAFDRSGPPAPVTMSEQAASPSAAGAVTVAAGDTLYEIARRYNVPVRELIEMNGLAPPYVLQVGQRLALPTARYHTVQGGDTLYAVSRLYQVDLAELARANGLAAPYQIRVGQQLRLPGANGVATATATDPATPAGAPLPGRKPGSTVVAAAPVAPAPPAAPPASPAVAAPRPGQGAVLPAIPSRQEPPPETLPPAAVPNTVHPSAIHPSAVPPAAVAQTPVVVPPKPPARTAAAAPPPAPVPEPVPSQPASPPPSPPSSPPPAEDPPPRTASTFAWPLRGEILSDFGSKPGGLHNDGINIAAAAGTPVTAAESGIVAYAGNELRGFGNLLLIRHADGWMTAYAHLQQMQVERGARVSRGQQIGTVGSTGNVTSPQLHFEVRRGSRAVNPREWLADRTVSRSGAPGGRRDPG
ncbi:LysM peptidoglycan-binding domain-containing M23 family metallopeptidase [Arenibaculum sp.]|uniref:LysM peptidoglycan-binding domain-containing M23 family metallopeptidase n=1 Tax=Arenibaculum sp. TaxID=2865862 RepID=UPI002E0F0163|nr:LysM peptidoglycan-binding domain-containing M23 family metallopeptidase [Arenibaculum sp.]